MMKDNSQDVYSAAGRPRTRLELSASELKYRRLFESAQDGILILNAESGMVVDVNPFLIERLGYSREQFLQKRIWELGFFRDIVANKASFDELKRKEYIRYADKPLKAADGRTLNVEFVSNVYLVNDHRVIQCNIRDITERKASEEKANLMRALIERSEDSIHVVDPATMRFLDTNESGCRNLGYTRNELLALTVPEVLVGVDQVIFDSNLAQIRAAGHAVFETPSRRKDGSTYPTEVSISLIVLSRSYLLAIVRDITKRRNAEDALRQEQTLFSDLGDAVPDNIYIKDRQSRFVRVNSAMARYLGLGHAMDAVGKTDFDVFGGDHAKTAYADEQRIMETGKAMIGVEEKETWPDGHVTWVSSTKTPLRDSTGCITGLVGISRDITERMRSDLLIREQNEILSKSHEGVIITSLSNKVTLWNHGAEEMFGWKAAEALGRQPEQLLGLDDSGAVSAFRAAVERDGFWRGELRSRTRAGRDLVLDARITLVRDADGRPKARLNFFADITEKKLLEEKYLHAQRLESIGMLAAGIAHDLNNVLAPMMFAAPLLRGSLSAPGDLKVLDVLEQSAGRGAALVKQILGFVHRATGEFRPTQVKHLAQDILDLIEQTFPKSIQVRFSLPNNLWLVMGDATQIHQVLLNLCVNARDAMPQGGTLRISAANRRLDAAGAAKIPGARPGVFCELVVADTGCGIPPDVMENIWKPFFTTKGAGKGTGLGLTTIRGIVASHSGFIEMHTKVGSGTTFRVFLPAVESGALAPGEGSPLPVPSGGGELILVVDDEAAIRKVVATTLEKQGYCITSCADGMEAITQFKARPGAFSLVITDVDMPRLGGAELIRELLKIRPDIRILVMGGLSRPDSDGRDLSDVQKLAQAFLHKPFAIGELLDSVHNLLHPAGR